MAQVAVSHLRLVENDAAQADSVQRPEDKWSTRATLIFVVGSSTALWGGILFAIWSAF